MSDQAGGGWHPDPAGRWQYRYWDGQQWTQHVRRGESVGIDRLTGNRPTEAAWTAQAAVADAREAASPHSSTGSTQPSSWTNVSAHLHGGDEDLEIVGEASYQSAL